MYILESYVRIWWYLCRCFSTPLDISECPCRNHIFISAVEDALSRCYIHLSRNSGCPTDTSWLFVFPETVLCTSQSLILDRWVHFMYRSWSQWESKDIHHMIPPERLGKGQQDFSLNYDFANWFLFDEALTSTSPIFVSARNRVLMWDSYPISHILYIWKFDAQCEGFL